MGSDKLKKWGFNLYLIATGALLYTLIQSPGYFLHTGETALVIMLTVLIILALVFLRKYLKAGRE